MKERHWKSLVASLRHGRCVLVLGSDIPVLKAHADGIGQSVVTSMVEELRQELERELADDHRVAAGTSFAALAQQVEDNADFGSIMLRTSAENILRSEVYRPSPEYCTLARLPFSLIVTTAQDNVLERALRDAGKSPIVARYHLRGDKRDNPEFLLPGSPACPVIYHLFGNSDEPASLVLSENDVLDFLIRVVSEQPPLPNSLLSALKRVGQSFLFLGFGINRWDLRILLKVLVRTLKLNQSGPSIAAESLSTLIPSDREEMVLFYQRGTRVEVEDEGVAGFVEGISRRLEAEGGFTGHAVSSGPRPRVFISYAHEDVALASNVYDSLMKAHFDPWFDKEALQGDPDWDQRIETDIDGSDFVLVLYTPNLCRKRDSYVNKEIKVSVERALRVRGPFLIPLRTAPVPAEDAIADLRKPDNMDLREAEYDADIAAVVSVMKREYQRRNR